MLAVLLAAPLLTSADSTIANVATPSIRHGLAASGSDAQFVVGGYTALAFALTALLATIPTYVATRPKPDRASGRTPAGHTALSPAVAAQAARRPR
jgi:hypothetical protein